MGMNLNDLKKKAQDALSKNSGKVEQGIDKASGFAKSRFGDKSDKIDDVTNKAKGYLHQQTDGDSGSQGSGGEQPPNQPPKPPDSNQPPNPPHQQ